VEIEEFAMPKTLCVSIVRQSDPGRCISSFLMCALVISQGMEVRRRQYEQRTITGRA
jgi:hypothetical protein